MTLPNSLLAYQDCMKLLETAVEDPVGIRLKCESYAAAAHLRNRIHYARKLHRADNARTYDADHVMHGRSEYDVIVIRLQNIAGDFYLYFERTDQIHGEIESLSDTAATDESPEEPASAEPTNELRRV